MRNYAKLKRTLFSILMLSVVTVLTTILVINVMFINYGPSIEGGNNIVAEPLPSTGIGEDKYQFGDEMEVDIFGLYFLEEGVSSSDGSNVIAPGTRNEHTFYVINNFDFAIDYTLTYSSFFGEDTVLPLLVRLRNDEGVYLIGSKDAYAEIEDLHEIVDHNTVGANRYHYYVFEWYWPFERGDDVGDTNLGNLTITEDLSITLEIDMGAIASEDVDSKDGIPLPTSKEVVAGQTLATGGVVLLALLIVVLSIKSQRKRVYHSED